MITAQEIRAKALEYGACELINGADTIAALIGLMRTPQGREFCKLHRFPTVDILRQHKVELASLGVFVDAGNIEVDNTDNVIIAGETSALLRYHNTRVPYHAIVMHGASAKVIGYGYSVCEVVNIGGEVSVYESSNASIFIR